MAPSSPFLFQERDPAEPARPRCVHLVPVGRLPHQLPLEGGARLRHDRRVHQVPIHHHRGARGVRLQVRGRRVSGYWFNEMIVIWSSNGIKWKGFGKLVPLSGVQKPPLP